MKLNNNLIVPSIIIGISIIIAAVIIYFGLGQIYFSGPSDSVFHDISLSIQELRLR